MNHKTHSTINSWFDWETENQQFSISYCCPEGKNAQNKVVNLLIIALDLIQPWINTINNNSSICIHQLTHHNFVFLPFECKCIFLYSGKPSRYATKAVFVLLHTHWLAIITLLAITNTLTNTQNTPFPWKKKNKTAQILYLQWYFQDDFFNHK